MAKRNGSTALNLLAWLTGVVVSLVVGNGMIQGALVLPTWLGGDTAPLIAIVIGWIVIITTLIGAVMALLRK